MVDTSDNRMQSKKTNENIASYGGEFESYLVSALNDSLIKKSKSECLIGNQCVLCVSDFL